MKIQLAQAASNGYFIAANRSFEERAKITPLHSAAHCMMICVHAALLVILGDESEEAESEKVDVLFGRTSDEFKESVYEKLYTDATEFAVVLGQLTLQYSSWQYIYNNLPPVIHGNDLDLLQTLGSFVRDCAAIRLDGRQ
jgi:hypothetical protein